MYSIVLCLDSNIPSKSTQGNTTLFLPNWHNVIWNMKAYHTKYKNMLTHTFSQTHEKNKFLIFPSQCLHKSDVIHNNHYFKLALKMDIWIKLYKHPNIPIYSRDVVCECNNCVDKEKRITRKYLHKTFGTNIYTAILSYLNIDSSLHKTAGCICKCICNEKLTCSCSCTKCVFCNHDYYYNDYDDYYDDYIDRTDECNGYE